MKKVIMTVLFLIALCWSRIPAFAQDDDWMEDSIQMLFDQMQISAPEAFSEEIPEEPVSKALIDTQAGTLTGSYTPCGDGTISLTLDLYRDDPDNTTYTESDGHTPLSYFVGKGDTAYIRNIYVDVQIGMTIYSHLELKGCKASGGSNCSVLHFDKNRHGTIKGYVQVPEVLTEASMNPYVTVFISNSAYLASLWDTPAYDLTVSGTASSDGHSICQDPLIVYTAGGGSPYKGVYDTSTGEARIAASVASYESPVNNHVIPGDVIVEGISYSDYICKYTLFDSMSGAPSTEYCQYGKGIKLPKNSVIKFDITIPQLKGPYGSDLEFYFRVGGMKSLIGPGTLEAVTRPGCKVGPHIEIMDPIIPYLKTYVPDKPIAPSGPYGVYDGGVWGKYEKCGRQAYIVIRLRNAGPEDMHLNLNNIVTAYNGGSPITFKWFAASSGIHHNNTVDLASGAEVTLLGRAFLTNYPSQLNSEWPMDVAVNLLDYGMYLTGKAYSDRNNTRCVPPHVY